MPAAFLALLPQILQGFQIAITAAPGVISMVTNIKALITSWFEAGLLTIDQQKSCHDFVDSVAAMVKAGLRPPQWTVEPDPVAPAK